MPYVVIRDQTGHLLAKTELPSPAVVGRSLDCDIWIQDTQVSRQHCRIESREGHWFITDLGSRNGTVVNGHTVTEKALSDGDTIELGKEKVTFYAGAMPAQRVADPLLAGLKDVEEESASLPASPTHASGRSESSLFATRVTSDESTIDTPGIGIFRPSMDQEVVPAPASTAGHSRRWPVMVGLATAAAVAVVMWLMRT